MPETPPGAGCGYTCNNINTGAAPEYACSGAATMALWAAFSKLNKTDNTQIPDLGNHAAIAKYVNIPARPPNKPIKSDYCGVGRTIWLGRCAIRSTCSNLVKIIPTFSKQEPGGRASKLQVILTNVLPSVPLRYNYIG